MTERMPIPAVNGGAVETLVDILISKNERDSIYNFTVYSPFDKNAEIKSKLLMNTSVKYITVKGLTSFLRKTYYKIFRKRYFFSSAKAASYIFSVSKLLRKDIGQYDAIIIENRAELGLYLRNAKESKLILHLHNDYLSSSVKNAKKKLETYDQVLTVSDYIKKRVLEINGDSKVITLHNGFESMMKTKQLKKVEEIKKEYSISESDKVVLFTLRRLIPEKGVKELIEAFLKIQVKGIKLIIVGFIDSKFGREMRELANQNSNIIFINYVSYENLPIFYQLADIGVVPSIWNDPFPSTVIEHLSAGNPVIVSDQGGIPEIVTDDCAITVKYDEDFISNISKAIEELATDNLKRDRMSKYAEIRFKSFESEVFWREFQRDLKIVDVET